MEIYGLTGQIIKCYATEIWPFNACLTYFVWCACGRNRTFSV